MAQRRMFSLKIISTDAFMEMPLSAQALYFHLGMRADDDGFVSNARSILRYVGASDDDFKLLLLKRFILAFDGSSVIVIKHWRLNNYVRGDRYTPTLYQEEYRQLYVKPNGAYTDHPLVQLPAVEEPEKLSVTNGYQFGIPNGNQMDTQYRLGQSRLEEDRLYKSSVDDINARACAREEIDEYMRSRQLDPSLIFGVTDEHISYAEELTYSIFFRMGCRYPTKQDVVRVFFTTYQQMQSENGEYVITFPKDKKELLLYAFEQAGRAGRPADWNYIDGVLSNLQYRGITTLKQAEDYDLERRGY